MRHWHWIIAALYGSIILALTLPVALIAFYPVSDSLNQDIGSTVTSFFEWWHYWVWLAVAILAQAALLAVPVRINGKRPVSKKAVYYPIIASGFMMGLLIVGAALSVCETVTQDPLASDMWWVSFAVLGLSWFLWGSIFKRWSRDLKPRNLIERQARYLFKGSVLELLIAVPAHVIARYRDYCCAGFATFVGIGFGLAVMLFSFGPGVYYLYAERWKSLHPKK